MNKKTLAQKLSKHWLLLASALLFDLLACLPIIAPVVNFCFGGILYLIFGMKKISKTAIVMVGGSILDFFAGILPVNLAAAVTRIATSAVFFMFLATAASAGSTDVDILWQAQTHTPNWYQGKALPTIQSYVKAVAINAPVGSNYGWYVNFEKDLISSGPAKNSFIFKIENYEEHVVSLKLSDQNGAVIAEKNVIIPIEQNEPKILFYQEDALLGPSFNQALQESFVMASETLKLKAEPYFFSKDDYLSFEWKMNEKELASQQNDRSLILRKPETSGSSLISLFIQNMTNVLQRTNKQIRINYE